jgi:hypothetical protein
VAWIGRATKKLPDFLESRNNAKLFLGLQTTTTILFPKKC